MKKAIAIVLLVLMTMTVIIPALAGSVCQCAECEVGTCSYHWTEWEETKRYTSGVGCTKYSKQVRRYVHQCDTCSYRKVVKAEYREVPIGTAW